jgi:formylglycine-generating enzyme required for sulfatase activity
MNHARRSRQAAVLTMFIIAFVGDIVLADIASDYEAVFGAEAKKVAASRSKTDDAAFAARLLKAAKDMPDSPAFQLLLYGKALQFGSAGISGCDTALEALGLLEEAAPDKKDEWRRKRFEVVKYRFDRSLGAARKAAGKGYMEMLEVLADADVAEGKGSEAKKLYSRAIMVAKYIKSDRVAIILAKSKRANAVVAQQVRLKSLQARLRKDAGNTEVRKELVLLYVVGLDNPAEAAKLLTDDLDEITRTYVPLAAKNLDDLDAAVCLELGDWYYRTLSKNVSAAGKPVVLQRARGYYLEFLDRHANKDLQSYRAKAALKGIEKELKKLGGSANHPRGRTLILDLGKGVTMKLVRIGAGKFMMGSPATEKYRGAEEGPQRQVAISKPFYMGVTEVTQAQYESVMGKNPSSFKDPGNPVNAVSWVDATAFCAALSKKTKRAVRLPTEAQWEYACRAGTKTSFSFGDDIKDLDAYGWSRANSGAKCQPVGRKKPNPFGLYDMHGNVWEWCRDRYDAKFYANAKNVDPENSTTETAYFVLRGASWGNNPDTCRSAHRAGSKSSSGSGLRVVVQSGSAGR